MRGVASCAEIEDSRRTEPAPSGLGERSMLEGWLEFHRMTLLLKCEGLEPEQLRRRPVTTSKLSLHGLVRHMAEVERGWFRRTFLIDPEPPTLYSTDEDPDGEFEDLENADWERDLATWLAECEASRRAAEGRSLDDTGSRHGVEFSLRWILTHLIEEYARHNGHADLIRELVDGSVGA